MRTSGNGTDLFVSIGLTATVAAVVGGAILYLALMGTLFVEHGRAAVAGGPGMVGGASLLVRGALADPAHPWRLYPVHGLEVNRVIFWTLAGLLLVVVSTVGTFVYSGVFAEGGWLRPGAGKQTHGESHWARGLELRGLGRRSWAAHLKADGIVLGWLGRRVLQSHREDSVLVFGVQRSGKTSTVVVPTLLGWRGAAVATSTKEELVRLTGRHRLGLGPVWVFAPVERDPAWITDLGLRPAIWNPVAEAFDTARALEIADLFTSDGKQGASSHWYLAAANLIAGLVLAARERDQDLRQVLSWLNSLTLNNFVGFAAQQRDPVAKELLTAFANTPPREAGSIASTARSCLSLWLDNRIAAATAAGPAAGRNLDMAQLLESAGTLYLVAPAEEAERCRPLFTALLQSLLAAATQRARRMPAGVLQPRLLLALDEVANFTRVPRLGGYTATGPGQGIQLLLCFHDLAQLEAAYGPEQARTIWNNCRARLLLPGQGDLRTLDHFSRAIGDETRSFDLGSWSEGRRSQSEQRIGKPLASADSLRRSRRPVLLYAGAPPARLSARRWDQVRTWRQQIEGRHQEPLTHRLRNWARTLGSLAFGHRSASSS